MPTTGARRARLYDQLGPLCHYCCQQMSPTDATIDHIVPRTFGGPDVMWNMVLAHKPCNNEKAMKVGVCECDRCRRALNRFNTTRKINPADRTPRAGKDKRKTRSLDQAVQVIIDRINGTQQSLDLLIAQDPMVAASLRGMAHGLQTALNVLRTVPHANIPAHEEPPAISLKAGATHVAQRLAYPAAAETAERLGIDRLHESWKNLTPEEVG